MSSFEIYERYNEISTDLIDVNPSVRQNAIARLVQLYYRAPELKLSVLSKLDQMKEDSDERVANYAKRVLQQFQSEKEIPPGYVPRRPEMESPATLAQPRTTQPPPKPKNVAANIICCVITIILFIVFYVFIF